MSPFAVVPEINQRMTLRDGTLHLPATEFRTLLKVVIIILVFCSRGTAQNGANQPATGTSIQTLSVTSRLVVLDLVVTDAQGAPIPNLTKDDFSVFQDGSPQRVRNFESWKDRPTTPGVPLVDRYGRQGWGPETPLTIFVLDELNTPFEEKAYAADCLRQYLVRQPALLASPSMLVTMNYTGLNTLSAYTRDRDALLRAIAHRPPTLPASTSRLELVSSSFGMLRQVALASEGISAHKTVIWLGRGFPSLDPLDFDDPSNAILKKAIQDTVDLLVAARITLYQVDPITTEARTATTDINAALDAGIAFNTQMTGDATTDLLDEKFSLNRFVLATGGKLYFGRNDLDNFIADGELRSTDFYTLSYSPPGDVASDVFHHISVQMRDPSWHVDTRRGYYATKGPVPGPTSRELGFDLKLASTSGMAFSSVIANITSVKNSAIHGKVGVSFSIVDNSLHWTPRKTGGDESKITVLLVSLDKGRNIQSFSATSLTLAVKDPVDVAAGRLRTTKEVAINDKTCSLRLIVRDSTGRIGTADIAYPALSNVEAWKPSSRCDVK
jgi:VWFA-related protein